MLGHIQILNKIQNQKKESFKNGSFFVHKNTGIKDHAIIK